MAAKHGEVYLVGAGPWAADLITVKGRQCLERAEVVVYDDLINPELLGLSPAAAERIYVGKRRGKKTLPQPEIGELLVAQAARGKRVVRLKGGDPFVFGRGGEEAERLAAAGVPFEVVPGVSAAVAAPAYAGIPLTHRDHADGFQVISGHAPDGPARLTAVVMMGMRRLADNVANLHSAGYDGDLPAAVVQWGTSSRQRTITATLETIAEAAAGVESPAVLVVGGVVELQQRIDWFSRRPLFGKRVLVTRSRHQAGQTCRLLEAQGAETVVMPTIAIRPPADPGPLDRAAAALSSYHYLLLTSANGVTALAEAVRRAGGDSRSFAGPQICAIGPGTAGALERLGLAADRVPDDHRAEGLLELLPEEEVRGSRVLLPRAEVAREVLPETLRARGAEVDLVPAYVTGLPDEASYAPGLARLRAGEVDIVTFTSASTVHNFVSIVGPEAARICAETLVAAIGPITAEACAEHGIGVDLMPPRYTLPALVQALVARRDS